MNSLSKSEKFWDKRSSGLDELISTYEQTYIQLIEKTRKYLHPSDLVLDYGCGTGKISIEISPDVKKIIAIDLSSGMLEIAGQKAAAAGIQNISFSHSTLADPSLNEGMFDIILLFNILPFMKSESLVIQRIRDILKPGGMVISSTPCLGEQRTWINRFTIFKSRIGLLPNIRHYKFRNLEELFISGDFQIMETEKIGEPPLNYFITARKMV
jgi:2-polyprenyl-3-methyl-5-hydroxy-6-metoxy-1,4-benzoquinol methylase